MVPQYRVILIVILTLHAISFGFGINMLRINFFFKSICSRKDRKNMCALTFDDGPDPHLTPAVLDLLDKYNAKATFFLIGIRAQENPDLVREIDRRGHTIGSHDLIHSNLSNFRMGKKLTIEIGKSLDILENILGKRPRLYRPPMGLANPSYAKVLTKLDLTCVGWNRRAFDRGNRSSMGIRGIGDLAKGGSVVMLHDALPNKKHREMILESLTKLLESLSQKKLTAVTIDSVFEIEPYSFH